MIRPLEVLYALGVLDEDAKLTSPIGFQVSEIPLRQTESVAEQQQSATTPVFADWANQRHTVEGGKKLEIEIENLKSLREIERPRDLERGIKSEGRDKGEVDVGVDGVEGFSGDKRKGKLSDCIPCGTGPISCATPTHALSAAQAAIYRWPDHTLSDLSILRNAFPNAQDLPLVPWSCSIDPLTSKGNGKEKYVAGTEVVANLLFDGPAPTIGGRRERRRLATTPASRERQQQPTADSGSRRRERPGEENGGQPQRDDDGGPAAGRGGGRREGGPAAGCGSTRTLQRRTRRLAEWTKAADGEKKGRELERESGDAGAASAAHGNAPRRRPRSGSGSAPA
ncbi:hypothetical protein Scep_005204 [Stephania cephalantha]|uniref:Helicase associated domain-containing protein n=1 Tax=Stephania cephalantha TaxID=152367 RepID=A0AAP0KUS5_9MAGN